MTLGEDNEIKIEMCQNFGGISSEKSTSYCKCGGIVGFASECGSIYCSDCYNNGNVLITSDYGYSGGIFGYYQSFSGSNFNKLLSIMIEKSVNSGEIKTTYKGYSSGFGNSYDDHKLKIYIDNCLNSGYVYGGKVSSIVLCYTDHSAYGCAVQHRR